MSVGILIITHSGIGSAMLSTAQRLLGACPCKVHCLDAPLDQDLDTLLGRARTELALLDDGDGVLILTDAFGATPSNLGSTLVAEGHTALVSGLNLPMLLRAFNYLSEDLDSLARKAAEGGTRGIQTLEQTLGIPA